MLTQTFPKLVSITCRRLCLIAQGLCLYRTCSVSGGEISLGSRAAVNTPGIPRLQALLWSKLLVLAFSSSHPHIPDHPSYPRTFALAFLLTWIAFPCPHFSHGHSLSVLKSQLKWYRSSFPDSPSPQTVSCPPSVKLPESTLCSSDFQGVVIYIYIYICGYICVMADLTSWIPSLLPTVKWPPLFQCWFQCLTRYRLLTNRGVDWRNEWLNR